MIAWAGIERYRRGWTTGIEEIDFFPRWPLVSDCDSCRRIAERSDTTRAFHSNGAVLDSVFQGVSLQVETATSGSTHALHVPSVSQLMS